jgi:hypothetical protein
LSRPTPDKPARWRTRPRLDAVVLLLALLTGFTTVRDGPLSGADATSPTDQAAAGVPTPAAAQPASSGTPLPTSGPVPSGGPPSSAVPSDTPPTGRTVTVASIPGLLAELADDSVDVIVVRAGTYHVSPSNQTRSDSLWIGHAFAGRTRPIVVRAETPGAVTFDGGGGSDYGGLSFEDGAHDQTWDGFTFANMGADESGIVEIGGYVARTTPHHITLRNITIEQTCTGRATTADAPTVDQAFYISNAATVGPNHLLFEDISVDGRGGLASAFQFDHGDRANPNASDVTVRRLHVIGTQSAIILWFPVLRNIVFTDVDIRDPLSHAIRYESKGGSGIIFAYITSSGSGAEPFFSSQGGKPPGVTFFNDSLH